MHLLLRTLIIVVATLAAGAGLVWLANMDRRVVITCGALLCLVLFVLTVFDLYYGRRP